MNLAASFDSLPAVAPLPAVSRARQPAVAAILSSYERRIVEQTHRLFSWLLVLQWVFAVGLAGFASPLAWAGAQSSVHPHVIAAVFLGAALVLPPLAMIRCRPYDALTRHAVAVAQVGFSSLLIHLCGGRIETHFHVFGSLAFVALYRDWKVIPTATVVVALDHLLRGLWLPASVYGIPYATVLRTLEHAAWVIFEDVVLLWGCYVSRREMVEICRRQDENQQLVEELRQRFDDRARELEAEERVRQENGREREKLHQQLLIASRQAGMAEVATGVLHNVGNVLTSVNITVQDVLDRLRTSRIGAFHRVVETIERERPRLGVFLTEDPVGRKLPDFLGKLDACLVEENGRLRHDVEELARHFGHIREVIVAQQNSARLFGVVENLPPAAIFEDAIKLATASFAPQGIAFERVFAEVPAVGADRHKVIQILVNLLKNAKDSVLSLEAGPRRIVARIEQVGDSRIALSVQDTGLGIPAENLTRIFQHGFTTKRDGHGFGLHSCVLAAREMKGDLAVASDGPGRGATFTLLLPLASGVASA